VLAAYRPALGLITGIAAIGMLVALSGLRRDRDRDRETIPLAELTPAAELAPAVNLVADQESVREPHPQADLRR